MFFSLKLFYFAFSAAENKHGENFFYAVLCVADKGEVNETAEKLLRFGRYVAKFRQQFLPLTSAFFRATYPLPEKAKKYENGKIRIVVC